MSGQATERFEGAPRERSRGALGRLGWYALASAALVWATVAGGGQAAASTGPDWTSLQGGPTHQGAAPAGAAPAPPLRVAWRANPAGSGPVSAIVVAGGVAVADGRSSVVAFDASTGRVLWRTPRASGPPDPPALDPAAGPGGHGVVVAPQGQGSSGNGVLGIALDSGRVLWRLPLPRPARGAPAIVGGTAFVGCEDHYVYAVGVASGKLEWRSETPYPVDAAPAVANGRVFVVSADASTSKATLVALDAATGRTLWRFSPPAPSFGASAVSVDGASAFAGLGDGDLRAFDAATGRVRWQTVVRDSFDPLATPAISGGTLFAADVSGGLYALRADSGARRWNYQFEELTGRGAPVVAAGTVYLGLTGGTIVAIDAASGDLVWRGRYVGGAVGPLTPAGSLLLAPLQGSGGVVALAHDPSGRLVSVPSPTVLHLPLGLANFLGAAVLLGAAILGIFRFALRPAPVDLDVSRGADAPPDPSPEAPPEPDPATPGVGGSASASRTSDPGSPRGGATGGATRRRPRRRR